MKRITTLLLLLLSFIGFGQNVAWAKVKAVKKTPTVVIPYSKELNASLYAYFKSLSPILKDNVAQSDSVIVNDDKKIFTIYANKYSESVPFRENVVRTAYDTVRSVLPEHLKNYKIEIFINGYEISDLVPNFYRVNQKIDKKRLNVDDNDEPNIVRRISPIRNFTKGLSGNSLAVWASHGCYFEHRENDWVWQRPRLFQVAEDTYTSEYVIPFIVPMLENAGAYVMMPRERDTQLNEVIVDNDDRDFLYDEVNDENHRWHTGDTSGFARSDAPYLDGDNPFCYGTYRQIRAHKNGSALASWSPNIPEDGDYAVYISYHTLPNSTKNARYTVYHTGGSTQFNVNQQMGGSTWIYLGTFHFKKGFNPEIASVELTNKGHNGTVITADAVRFGGGYGVVAKRNAEDSIVFSNKPKYLEGARYWLQWAGFPDSVYSHTEFTDDYKDDYMSRGHWVNHLIGGSSKSPDTQGLNIPIQLAFGLHTDAGYVHKDSVIGTMGIYMSESNDRRTYDAGNRRIASRDFADLIQTQVVSDIRQTLRPNWTRRKLTDASYYEARVPQVPSTLLELLSHQNFTDMRYGLDPHFHFIVSRAIYKGILKFLCTQQNRPYIVQPLPVHKFHAEFSNNEHNVVILNWEAQIDSLEPTATPDRYILYTAIGDNGWNDGELVTSSSAQVSLNPNQIYRFKVTACNDGGESFPSEVLTAGYVPNSDKTALIINGFHRVSAPSSFDTPLYSGFLDSDDHGVPYYYDLSYTGSQYVFNKYRKFKTNHTPGHGASHALFENNKIAGNTFDYTYPHGKAILAAGYSFVSCSDEVIYEGGFGLRTFNFVDLILGEQKSTKVGDEIRYQLFPQKLRVKLENYLTKAHGNLFVSGAYVASDIFERDSCDENAIRFAIKTLHYKLSESHVSTGGLISNYFSIWKEFGTQYYHYCNVLNDKQYAVEAPDGIDTANGSQIIHSFEGSNLPATVGYRGRYKTFVSSVPFESIEGEDEKISFMKEIISFFEK